MKILRVLRVVFPGISPASTGVPETSREMVSSASGYSIVNILLYKTKNVTDSTEIQCSANVLSGPMDTPLATKEIKEEKNSMRS